jgi:3-deoxy-manno-octulosonate cytidylyltransferase (CMP-KDO synthetase)
MKTAVVIPARYASTRFPGKPLHLLAGRPMIQHVWERCLRARRAVAVLVATDDERIRAVAAGFGAEVVMTRADHPSGTDRLAEVALARPEFEVLVNVQGDEPLVEPELIDRLAEAVAGDPGVDIATAAVPLTDPAMIRDPNVVKAVAAPDGRALYFSRSPVPWDRAAGGPAATCLWHKGIYAYRREFLLRFVTWPPSPLECREQLEQLRALEHGACIRIVQTASTAPGVDTPEQAAEVERLLLAGA